MQAVATNSRSELANHQAFPIAIMDETGMRTTYVA